MWRVCRVKRKDGDFAKLDFHHPTRRLLKNYKNYGVPVKLATKPWSKRRIRRALLRGPHKSYFEYLDFLQEEFVDMDMIQKQQRVMLPYSAVKDLSCLRQSPPGCSPQRAWRPHWIFYYKWSEVNPETLPIAALESIQFGHVLDRILREIYCNYL